jgi:DNA-binding transcriptional LysR family regulator
VCNPASARILRLTLFDRSGKTPVLTEAGRTILNDARQVVQRADALRTHAETIAGGTEPELAFAVDPLFPTDILMESLRALQVAFPCLPVTLLTEGLGATEQRLRDGQARFAIYSILTTGADDLDAKFLTHIAMVPVVAESHPLAAEAGSTACASGASPTSRPAWSIFLPGLAGATCPGTW